MTTLTYTYDSMGNRLTKNEGTAVNYAYTTYNKLTGDGTYTYAYDRDGNVIWKNRTNNVRYNYIYNSFGQMTEVKRQTYSGGWGPLTTIARYYYDANGARAKTDESGTIDSYVYAGHDPLLHVAADGRSDKYLNLGGKLEVRQITGSESYVYIADALGSTRKVLRNGDSAQTTFSASAYMPFGKACGVTGSDEVTFAGETLDSPSGLVYLFARYYDPELGRFYALDPELGKLSMPQSLDRWIYCMDNPLKYRDSTGANPVLIAVLAFALVGIILGGLTGPDGDWVAGAIAGGAAGALFPILLALGPIGTWLAGPICGFANGFLRTLIHTGNGAQAVSDGLEAAGWATLFTFLFKGLGPIIPASIGQKIVESVGKFVVATPEQILMFANALFARTLGQILTRILSPLVRDARGSPIQPLLSFLVAPFVGIAQFLLGGSGSAPSSTSSGSTDGLVAGGVLGLITTIQEKTATVSQTLLSATSSGILTAIDGVAIGRWPL